MNRRDRILAIVACLLWSTAFPAVKAGLLYMPPLTLAGIRFLLAALMLLPWVGGWRSLQRAGRSHYRTVILAALLNTVGLYALFFLAMQVVRGAQAAIMIGSSPLIYALVAHCVMKNDRMTRQRWTSLMFGISGIALLSLAGKPWDPVGAKESLGLLLLLAASVTGAFGNVVVAKGISPDLDPVALTCLQMLVGGAILLIGGVAIEGRPSFAQPPAFYGILGWLAFLSAGAFSIWFHLLQRVPISELNLWKFLVPLAGAILSWLLLKGEHPDLLSVGGMILVSLGIFWNQRASQRTV